jgi:hypothetical protein
MAFLDFLRPKGNGKAKPPADQRADIDAALAKIAVERASAQLVLDGLDRPRRLVAGRCAGERDREG